MDIYQKIAKNALKSHFFGRAVEFDPKELTPELTDKKAGVFVSLYTDGALRGCIGTIEPTEENLLEEIKNNAVSAATQDNRFESINSDEVESLEISVHIINKPELIKTKKELDPKKYGVVVQKGFQRGLLLPDLDGVDNIDQQLEIACSKAGIDYSSDYEIYKFTVEKHG